jgi:hypothetical protein
LVVVMMMGSFKVSVTSQLVGDEMEKINEIIIRDPGKLGKP